MKDDDNENDDEEEEHGEREQQQRAEQGPPAGGRGVSSGLQTLENAAQEKTFRREFDNELDFKSIFTPEIL